MVKFDPKLLIPFAPELNRPFSQTRVVFVRAIGSADRFANIGGGGQRMGERTGVD